MLLKGIWIFLILILVPMLFGNCFCRLAKWQESLACQYVAGTIIMWAVFQLMAVPMVYKMLPFSALFKAYSITIVCLVLLCLVWQLQRRIRKGEELWQFSSHKEHFIRVVKGKRGILVVVLTACMLCSIGFQMSRYVFYAHRDDDDSRFVVTAAEAYENDLMYTSLANGEDTGEINVDRDVTSPWSMYVAWQSRVVQIYPTIMCHTILPFFLLLMGYCVIWMLGFTWFHGKILYTVAFTLAVSLINAFFDLSVYTAATFFLIRVWQGKAMVAGAIVPLLLCLYYQAYKEEKNGWNDLLIALTNTAACLLSGAGILTVPIVNFAYGTSCAIGKKSLRSFLRMILVMLPALCYGVVYYILIKE